MGLVHDGCRLARGVFAAGIEVFNEPLSATEPGVIAHTLYHLSLHAMGPPASMASLTQAQLFLLTAVHYRRDDAPVFTSRKGGSLDTRQVHRIVRAAGERVGVEGVSPHWLRHAHASHALERGAPIHLVQATLGHASVATTGVYLHARPTESSGRYLAV